MPQASSARASSGDSLPIPDGAIKAAQITHYYRPGASVCVTEPMAQQALGAVADAGYVILERATFDLFMRENEELHGHRGAAWQFLASIATAQPQSEQAEWMIEQARTGLERSGRG